MNFVDKLWCLIFNSPITILDLNENLVVYCIPCLKDIYYIGYYRFLKLAVPALLKERRDKVVQFVLMQALQSML